ICPYHAWSYATDGKLVGVQDYDRLYQPPFDKAGWGLVEVAQLANFDGTIWATPPSGCVALCVLGTAATVRPSCSAPCRNGSCRPIGNSSLRISRAIS